MKKVIRHSVFETNSSSVHSIIFRNGSGCKHETPEGYVKEWLADGDGNIFVKPGEYGWSGPVVEGIYQKISYLMTMMLDNFKWDWNATNDDGHGRTVEEQIELLEADKGWQELVRIINDKFNVTVKPLVREGDYYYVDHQSRYDSIDDFLTTNSLSMSEFLFDNDLGVKISNDNMDSDDMDAEQAELEKGGWA